MEVCLSLLSIDRTAFEVFGWPIQWYGIILTAGILCAFIFLIFHSKKAGFKNPDIVFDIFLSAIISAVIGARLVYVVANSDMGYFPITSWEDFLRLFAIWEGGITIIGGIIFGAFGLWVCARINKESTFKIIDIVVPCMLIGQIIGRWGNFVNQEAFGKVVTNPDFFGLPFSVFIDFDSAWHQATFLYESILNTIGLVLILFLSRKKVKTGIITFAYFMWYSVVRFIMEFSRMDAVVKDWGALGMVNITQVFCVILFIVGLIFTILIQKGVIKLGAKSNINGGSSGNDGNSMSEISLSDEEKKEIDGFGG